MRISDWSSDVCSSDLANLHRNWVMIPHVTNNDEADITDLEALRVTLNKENEKSGIKIGRASCRERVCQYVSISVVAVSLQKQQANPQPTLASQPTKVT